ncbi:MAG: hypothetical protein R3E39_16060 [Anaerolineae bacterium]
MSTVNAKTESFFERHSWKALLVMSIIMLIFGAGDIIQGVSADPAIAKSMTGIEWDTLQRSNPAIAYFIDVQVRLGGTQLTILAVLSIVICLVGYRRGSRWAWYALWTWPLLMVMIFLVFATANRQPEFPPPHQ